MAETNSQRAAIAKLFAADPGLFNPEEIGTRTFYITLFFSVLALIIGMARLFVRRIVVKSFGWDDLFTIFSLLSASTMSSVIIASTYFGVGRHIGTLLARPDDVIMFLKLGYVTIVLYMPVVLFIKLSIQLFLLRIFPNYRLSIVIKWLMGFMILFTISNETVMIWVCRPISNLWAPIPGGKCMEQETLYGISMMQAVLAVITDVITLVLPMPVLWGLNMKTSRKISLMGLFGLGTVACIAAIIRLHTLTTFRNRIDSTFGAANTLLWSQLEYNLAIIAASLPSLKVLFFKNESTNAETISGSHRLKSLSGSSYRSYPTKSNEAAMEAGVVGMENESQENIIHSSEITSLGDVAMSEVLKPIKEEMV